MAQVQFFVCLLLVSNIFKECLVLQNFVFIKVLCSWIFSVNKIKFLFVWELVIAVNLIYLMKLE